MAWLIKVHHIWRTIWFNIEVVWFIVTADSELLQLCTSYSSTEVLQLRSACPVIEA